KGENRTTDIAAQLTNRVSALAFKGESSDESRAFEDNLLSKLEAAAAGKNIESPEVAAAFNKIISDALKSEKSGFTQRTDELIAEDTATVEKAREGIAAKDKEIEASKNAQAELKKKAQEEAASREAAKKAKDAEAKQKAAADTSPAGAGAAIPPDFAGEPVLGNSQDSVLNYNLETGEFSAVPKTAAKQAAGAAPGTPTIGPEEA
ncbi:MAG: hypothetical protein ACYS8Y_07175, partial [Planctomycetota bacterium]